MYFTYIYFLKFFVISYIIEKDIFIIYIQFLEGNIENSTRYAEKR